MGAPTILGVWGLESRLEAVLYAHLYWRHKELLVVGSIGSDLYTGGFNLQPSAIP